MPKKQHRKPKQNFKFKTAKGVQYEVVWSQTSDTKLSVYALARKMKNPEFK